jgi:hypothetical protein
MSELQARSQRKATVMRIFECSSVDLYIESRSLLLGSLPAGSTPGRALFAKQGGGRNHLRRKYEMKYELRNQRNSKEAREFLTCGCEMFRYPIESADQVSAGMVRLCLDNGTACHGVDVMKYLQACA